MISKVIRDVKCSVLLVPRAAHFWHRGILAAVGNPTAAPAIARIAGTLAGICALPLKVLSVGENASEMGKMQELNAPALELASAVSDKASGRVVLNYLLPSRYCESERFIELAQEIVAGVAPGYDQVAAIVKWIGDQIHFNSESTQFQLGSRGQSAARRGVP